MAASSNDKFSSTYSGDIAAVATVTSPRATGVTALSVDTQLNWPTDTGIKFSTFKLDSNNNTVAGSQTDWKGVSNGSNALSNLIRTGGAADTGNAVGDKVVMLITAAWGDDIAKGISVAHNVDGTLKQTAVQSAIGTGGITTTYIADGGVTDSKIAAVSTTKTTNPYKFSVYRNESFVTSTAFATAVQYDTRNFDTGNNVDIITNKGRFIAPVAGFYWFEGSCGVSTTSAVRFFVSVYKNAVEYKRGYDANLSSGNIYNAQVSSGLMQLAANDYVEIYNFTSASQTGVNGITTSFSGFLMSTT